MALAGTKPPGRGPAPITPSRGGRPTLGGAPQMMTSGSLWTPGGVRGVPRGSIGAGPGRPQFGSPGVLMPSAPPGPGGGGAGAGAGAGAGGGGGGPAAPTIGPWDISRPADPEFDRARQRAEDYLGELKTGTGYAMDVYQGSAQAQIDADVERARESAAAQGIPFDEAGYRRDANAKMQAGLAQEKLGRERMYGEQMAGLQDVIGGGAANRLAKGGLELERLKGKTGAEIDVWRTTIQKQLEEYRIAMDALRGWMSSAFGEDA